MKRLLSALKRTFSLSGSPQPDTRFAVDTPPPPHRANLAMANNDPGEPDTVAGEGAPAVPETPPVEPETPPELREQAEIDRLALQTIEEFKAQRDNRSLAEAPPDAAEPMIEVIEDSRNKTEVADDELVDSAVSAAEQVASTPAIESTPESGDVMMAPKGSKTERKIETALQAAEEDIEVIGGRRARVLQRHPDSKLPTRFEYLEKDETAAENLRTAGEVLAEQGGPGGLGEAPVPTSPTEEEIAAKMDKAVADTSPAAEEPVVQAEVADPEGKDKDLPVIKAELAPDVRGDAGEVKMIKPGTPEHERLAQQFRAAGIESDVTRAADEAREKAEKDISSTPPRPGRGQTVNKGGADKPFGEASLDDLRVSLGDKEKELQFAKDTARPLEQARLEEEVAVLEKEVDDREKRRDGMNKAISERRQSRLKEQELEGRSRERMVEGAKSSRRKQEAAEEAKAEREAPRARTSRLEALSSRRLEKQLRRREKEVASLELLREAAFKRMKKGERGLKGAQERAEAYKSSILLGPLMRWNARGVERDFANDRRRLENAERNLGGQVENRNRVVLVLENRLRDQLVEPERRAHDARATLESAESLFDTMGQTLGGLESQLNNLEDAASDPSRHAELMDRSWREQVERIRGQVLEQRVQLREYETRVLEYRARLAGEQSKVDSITEQIVEYVRRSRIPEALDLQTARQGGPAQESPPVPPQPPAPPPVEVTPVENAPVAPPENEDFDEEDEEDEEPSEPQYGVERFVELNNTYFRTKDGQVNAPEINPQDFKAKLEEVQQRRQHEENADNATAEDLVDALGLLYKAAGAEATPEFWESLRGEVEGNQLIEPTS